MTDSAKALKPSNEVSLGMLRKRRSSTMHNSGSHRSFFSRHSNSFSKSHQHRSSSSLTSKKSSLSAWNKFWLRIAMGALMIASFSAILYGGHLYAWILVVVLQTLIFKELVNVRYRAAAEKNIPWFRSIQASWTMFEGEKRYFIDFVVVMVLSRTHLQLWRFVCDFC